MGPRVRSQFERLFVRNPNLDCVRDAVLEAYQLLCDCYAAKGKLLLMGNGGSAADCEHISGELMKGFLLKRPLEDALTERINARSDMLFPNLGNLLQQGLPVIVLTNHASLSTAVQNDLDPAVAPAQQVVTYAAPYDVFLGISTSGNAKNVALAMCVAQAMGLPTIAMTGEKGGRLATLADVTIRVPAATPADVQEYHLPVYHALCAMVEATFFER